jgi:alpha-D-xyloside xylohydrolase
VPWLFDEESVEVLRTFTRLKMRLMPYLAGAARQAYTDGIPIMRAMVVEFPDDPACAHLEQQYLLGPDLLVAPVFSATGEVSYYVPAGRWTNILSGAVVDGPAWVREQHGFDSVPVLARPGGAIAFGARDDRPDYDYSDGVTLHLYQPGGGERTTLVPTIRGGVAATFSVRRTDHEIRIDRRGTPAWWRILLPGVRSIDAIESVDGGSLSGSDQGPLIVVAGEISSCTIALAR